MLFVSKPHNWQLNVAKVPTLGFDPIVISGTRPERALPWAHLLLLDENYRMICLITCPVNKLETDRVCQEGTSTPKASFVPLCFPVGTRFSAKEISIRVTSL